MTTTIKTPVTIATFYVSFSDDTPNGAHRHLFYGKPSKGDIKKAFTKAFEGNAIKKATVVDVERVNLTIDITSAFLVKTIGDLIEEIAHNTLDFESTIID
jgi:hypothetical protein